MRTRIFFLSILLIGLTAGSFGQQRPRSTQPRYIIFMMADGMGVDELELGRQYSLKVLGRDLFLTSVLAQKGVVSLMDTYSRSSEVTDSAAGATAWAIGRKVKNGMISVDPDTNEPLETVLEFYKEKYGYRTGIVSNDAITGASPSAWAAHVKDRGMAEEIARQFCDQTRPFVILGGGRSAFLSKNRKDGRDLIEEFVTEHGYQYVQTARELAMVKKGPVLGLFGDGILTLHIDRPPAGSAEPRTGDMTEAAIRLLTKDNPGGFFLFVEECQPDKTGHANDAAAAVQGVLEIDRTAAIAYRFYQEHPDETLLIVTADHETGALQWLYSYDWSKAIATGDTPAGQEAPLDRLASVDRSIGAAAAGLNEQLSPEEQARLRWRYRHFRFDPQLDRAVREGRDTLGNMGRDWKRVLTQLTARNTGAYYTSGGHSQVAVPFFAIGVGAERFRGHTDNAEVGRELFRLGGRQDFRP